MRMPEITGAGRHYSPMISSEVADGLPAGAERARSIYGSVKRLKILTYVARHPGCTAPEISRALGDFTSDFKRNLELLREAGYLTSVQDRGQKGHPHRHRINRVQIVADNRELVEFVISPGHEV